MRPSQEEISSRVERLLSAQPTAPPEARRVRRPFPVVGIRDESARYVAVEVAVDGEFAESHRRPSQYTTVKLEGWPARFYVLANLPGAETWEFLVDRESESGRRIAELRRGESLWLSLAEGGGFDADEVRGKEALLFATGSGVATLKPLVEIWLSRAAGEGPARIVMHLGEARPDDFAYEAELKRWQEQGVTLRRAVESWDEEPGAFRFRYVQHAFDACPRPVDEAYAYLSGAPVMIQMTARMLMQRGMRPGRVKINI